MSPQLNPEFASSVQLPLNPLARHREVIRMLADPSMVGEGTRVLVNPSFMKADITPNTIVIPAMVPILGRRTLKSAAIDVQHIFNQGVSNG